MRKIFSLTNLRKGQSRSILIMLAFVIFSGMIYLPGCSKVDDAIDSALDFSGVFTSTDGWEVNLDGTSATVTKEGETRGSTAPHVGDYTMKDMTRTSDNSWSGTVLDENLETMVSGTATIKNNVLTVQPTGSSLYYTFTFTKKSTTSTSTGTGTVTGTPTVTPTGPDTVLDKYVDGSWTEKKTYYYTAGAGIKKVEIILTEGIADDGQNATHNTADLFVSIDPSSPSITDEDPYVWVADKGSVNMNRISEYISYSNPPSGRKYNILVYGHNTFFLSRLIIILTK
jgi:hypothetical protein